MATRTKNMAALAKDVLAGVGGAQNVTGLTSCFTRLRFVLKDESLANRAALEATEGVLSVVNAGGQTQVVIGSDVPQVREEVEKLIGVVASADAPAKASGSVVDRFVALVSALFQPFLWVLAGSGLLKALLTVLTTLKVLDPSTSTVTILNAGADSIFYFLPLFLGFTAGKRFNANPYLAVALAGGLVYPAITTLGSDGNPVTFLGIPVVMMSYASSVIPIIIIVWVQSYVEKFFKKVLPASLVNFLSPALILLVLFPLSLLTIGPATTYLSQLIAGALTALYAFTPVLTGLLIGGAAQALVVFGLHWAIIAVIINEYGTLGHSTTILPFYAAVTAQTGAALAVFVRTRNAKLKQVAGPAALSGLLAGITEPILYGVNLPLRRPFIIGLISGAVGGAVVGASGVVSNAFAIPSLITMPVALGTGNFPLFVIGVVGAMVLAFVLTMIFGFKEPADTTTTATAATPAAVAATAATATAQPTTTVVAPVSGFTLPLADVNDKVFASGTMGAGIGIKPISGRIKAPVAGKLIACMPHAYGIRTADGVEVLVHVGLDTVKLGGTHFTPAVAAGDRVDAGDLLCDVDLRAVEEAGYDPTTVVIVMNSASLAAVEAVAAASVSSGDPVLTLTK